MDAKELKIILAAVLGGLVLLLAIVLILLCWRQSQRRLRGFSLRSATPLDDAEIESWRRPSQHVQRPPKYTIKPRPDMVDVEHRANITEKDFLHYGTPRTLSLASEDAKTLPSFQIQRPERARRKSSVCSSIADRPPTPYSPTRPPSDIPLSPIISPRSARSSPRAHYHSPSEVSSFRFGFHDDVDVHDDYDGWPSTNSERPLRFHGRYDSLSNRVL